MNNRKKSLLPPPIGVGEFNAVDTYNAEDAVAATRHFVIRLHAYLENLDCLEGIHYLHHYRLADGSKSVKYYEIDCLGAGSAERDNPGLGCFVSTYYGEFDEAHFGMALFSGHFRIGVGFKLTGCYSQEARAALERFTKTLIADADASRRFVRRNSFEVEAYGSEGLIFIPSENAVDWLIEKRDEWFMWLYLGRILRREQDREVLENPAALAGAIESALIELRALWDKL